MKYLIILAVMIIVSIYNKIRKNKIRNNTFKDKNKKETEVFDIFLEYLNVKEN